MAQVEKLPARKVEKGRLAYYRQKPDANYWDGHWSERIRPALYREAQEEIRAKFGGVMEEYLPKNDLILEAGCGPGQCVFALRQWGYHVEGVEWGAKTVQKAKDLLPDLPIRQGDVCRLDVKDGSYGGYISLGVIEHRKEGPEPFLTEAFRILKSGGIAIFSVPWFNSLRRLKALLGCFRKMDVEGLEFYQYAYRTDELSVSLRRAGFRILETRSSRNIQMGFEEELPFLLWVYRKGKVGRVIQRNIRKVCLRLGMFGHTRLYVCCKP